MDSEQIQASFENKVQLFRTAYDKFAEAAREAHCDTASVKFKVSACEALKDTVVPFMKAQMNGNADAVIHHLLMAIIELIAQENTTLNNIN